MEILVAVQKRVMQLDHHLQSDPFRVMIQVFSKFLVVGSDRNQKQMSTLIVSLHLTQSKAGFLDFKLQKG